jgi:hypothetical protein
VGPGLETLLRATWLLANLVNRNLTAEDGPVVRFTPGIADRGAWGCTVDIDFTAEGKGLRKSSFHGTIDSCLQHVNKEIDARLGTGYRYRDQLP